ncbi:TetR/AcrR family transcriptional regulator [Mycobacterium sp.]|uniref:TetR/AcrR family transcriptional regulator n=1 Tax=Mycobacterium sp. TaxID=1785 RepID=UPI0012888A0D|nr:TetR/AcrR family transcriptional regulator [Mycobacterium sp.]KAA8946851.1 MAG: TetR/AcrR family transcriptional regulator [Mycobacterium sp.]
MATTATKPRARNPRGKGTQLRDDLIAAARRLLDRHGQESAVTIRAVTREAGVAPQSFYLHFPTRDDLLLVLFREGHQQLYERLESPARSAGTPEQRLRAVCAAYLAFADDNPAAYRTLMSVVGEVHDWKPQELPGIESFAILNNAVADVRATPPQKARAAAAAVWAHLHGIAELTRNKPTFPWPSTETLLDHVIATARG